MTILAVFGVVYELWNCALYNFLQPLHPLRSHHSHHCVSDSLNLWFSFNYNLVCREIFGYPTSVPPCRKDRESVDEIAQKSMLVPKVCDGSVGEIFRCKVRPADSAECPPGARKLFRHEGPSWTKDRRTSAPTPYASSSIVVMAICLFSPHTNRLVSLAPHPKGIIAKMSFLLSQGRI